MIFPTSDMQSLHRFNIEGSAAQREPINIVLMFGTLVHALLSARWNGSSITTAPHPHSDIDVVVVAVVVGQPSL